MPVSMEIGPMHLLRNIMLMVRQHREFRAALAELNDHTDRELSELGIARVDITRVAYEEAERRMATTPARAHATTWPNVELASGR